MKFVVRQGKKRGRGAYLTYSPIGVMIVGMYFYSRRKHRALKFNSKVDAIAAARSCFQITTYRVVKLKPKR